MKSSPRRRSVIPHHRHEVKSSATKAKTSQSMKEIPQLVQRRVIPGCEPVYCWGFHAGREWCVTGGSAGTLSVLCNGAAGASNHKKSFSLWQVIDIKECVTGESHNNIGNSDSEESDSKWKVTALAWCKLPASKLADHPLDPASPYCAAFAAGTHGRISIFYPSSRDLGDWELVSVLHPTGDVSCLSWAPEGHHLVSGGEQLILWSPDSHALEESVRIGSNESTTGSVASGASAYSHSNVERNHQKLLMARAPMVAAVMSETKSIESSNYVSVDDNKGAVFDASWTHECKESPIKYCDFSADGRMFATVSENSLEVCVWFEGESAFGACDYVSLFHPKAVLCVVFRSRGLGSTHHVLPQNSHTPQTLVTLCKDNCVRVWQESDPQTEEFSMFVCASFNQSSSPLRSIGWLHFISYFEGLRSPFAEHNGYSADREDFILGFNSSSPFFHNTSHFCTVWGEHQKRCVELRMGPTAQETRSSLDWLVGVDCYGKVCMWSLEGLSSSPRRDIHTTPWNRSCEQNFKHNYVAHPHHTQSPFYRVKRNKELYHQSLRRRSSSSSYPTKPVVKESSMGCSYLVATCRATQEFDPHSERDPWPSTSSFDINPRNVEVLSFSEMGLEYIFAEADLGNELTAESPFGLVTHKDVCLVRGHLAEITRLTFESVVDTSSSCSRLEESFWVTTQDMNGVACAWPARYGSEEEEIDADALCRERSITLPLVGKVALACCSEICASVLIAIVVSLDKKVLVFLRSETERNWTFVQEILFPREGSITDIFVVRNESYVLTLGLAHSDGDGLAIFEVKASLDEVQRQQTPRACTVDLEVTQRVNHSSLQAVCWCPATDKQLIRHGVVVLVGTSAGKCLLLGSDSDTVIAEFNVAKTSTNRTKDPDVSVLKKLSNSASGKILTVQESGLIQVWQPGLCHLRFHLEATILPPSVDSTVITAHALNLGAGIDVIGVGVLERHGTKVQPKVIVYSKSFSNAQYRRRGISGAVYEPICSTREALTGNVLCGISWSGRDFGLVVASSNEVHLFQGWFRHPVSDHLSEDLTKLRRRLELEKRNHKIKSSSIVDGSTDQIESVNSIGDTAVGLQLPVELYRPRAIFECLRAGWVKPTRNILQFILKKLKHRQRLNMEMYSEDEKLPPKALLVKPPKITLREFLAGVEKEAGYVNKALQKEREEEEKQRQEEAEEEKPATAASLFADDDWSMGGGFGSGASKPKSAASALFDEDPWEAIAKKDTTFSPTSPSRRGGDDGKTCELSELLVSYNLVGFSPKEQLQLTAMAGVFNQIYGMDEDSSGNSGFGKGVDEAGARYMLAFHIFKVQTKCLSPMDRPLSMVTADVVWAFESDSQDAFIHEVLPALKSTWTDAKRFGVGLWLKSGMKASTLAEELAKAQYQQSRRDPFSCALFYFALGKPNVVAGLFRIVKNTKAAELLSNDFSEERYQTIAVKNAFSLLQQRKFEQAAAFFVLGGRLAEATNLCIKNLKDYQLALFLCKLVEGDDGPVQQGIWLTVVRPLALWSGDPFLASMAYSALGESEKSVCSFQANFNEDVESVLAEPKVSSREVLMRLEEAAYPTLTTSFNTLEPIYVGFITSDAKRQAGLTNPKMKKAILQQSMRRAANHYSLMGLPLLALRLLDSIDKGSLCDSCGLQKRVRLAAQSFHSSLVRAHSSHVYSGENDDDSEEEAENNGPTDLSSKDKVSMVLSQRCLENLRLDLLAVLKTSKDGLIPIEEVLESLWKISRTSNHLAIEFSIIRLFENKKDEAKKRLQQIMRSISASFTFLGQGMVDIDVSYERRLLPGRRLASYAVFLDDLCGHIGALLQDTGNNDVSVMARYRHLLQTYAKSALFCASYLTHNRQLVKSLLSKDFTEVRKAAMEISLSFYDYEELLEYENCHSNIWLSFRSAAYDDVLDDEDLSGWGLSYAKLLMDVVIVRKLVGHLISEKEVIAGLHRTSPSSTLKKRVLNLQPLGKKHPDDVTGTGPVEYTVANAEDLLQACWPLCWTFLSDLQVNHIPVGLSGVGVDRLEAMKSQAFVDKEEQDLFKFLKGKEQLRIVDATAKWTERTLDQERTRSGYLPDTKIFCSDNCKVVYSEPGHLLLSVDEIKALEGTIVIAMDRGTEVVNYTFDDTLDIEGGSEDEDSGSFRSPMRDELTVATDNMSTGSRHSMPIQVERSRARSSSDNDLPFFNLGDANTDGGGDHVTSPKSPDTAHSISSSQSAMSNSLRRRISPHLPRPRRPHIRLRRIASLRKRANRNKASKFCHSWSSSAKTLLMVSKTTDRLWWDECIRVPLNHNLYCDSFSHSVSAHGRVSTLLRNGSGNVDLVHRRINSVSSTGSIKKSRRLKISTKKGDDKAAKTVMSVCGHPFLPYYVSAQFDGSSILWDASDDGKEAITLFKKPSDDSRKWKSAHTTRVRFSEDGCRLAACDSAGQLLLYNLGDAVDGENDAFGRFLCHTKRTLDCAFLNYNGNIVATVGQSQHSENLCVFDLSVPPRSCRVASVHCCSHTAAYSLTHLQDQQVLLIGGGNGSLSVFDLRQRMLISEEDHVHTKAIRSLCVHPTRGHYLASGSTDGTIKLWTYRGGKLNSHAHLTSMHPTHMLLNEVTSDSMISQRGTTDVAFSMDFLYSCGADGKVKMTPLSSLMM